MCVEEGEGRGDALIFIVSLCNSILTLMPIRGISIVGSMGTRVLD